MFSISPTRSKHGIPAYIPTTPYAQYLSEPNMAGSETDNYWTIPRLSDSGGEKWQVRTKNNPIPQVNNFKEGYLKSRVGLAFYDYVVVFFNPSEYNP